MLFVFNVVQNILLLEPGEDEALSIIRYLFLAGVAGVTDCLTISPCGMATKTLSNAFSSSV